MPKSNTIKNPKDFNVSVSFIAHFFGVDQKTIQNWVRAGMPHESRKPYNFYRCVKWRIEELNLEVEAAKKGSETFIQAQSRFMTIKADRAQIELAKERAEVITVKDADKEIQKTLRVINAKARAYPRGNAEELAGIDTPAEVEEYLNNTLVNELLTETYTVSDRLLSVAKSQEVDQAILEDITAADKENTERTGRARAGNDNRRGKRSR